ncbi:MAG: hypothetical protein ACRD3O_24130, partial [Terriglobia bacterium]
AYSFGLERGQYALISVEQSKGLLQAALVDPDRTKQTPVTLDEGKTSIIRLPVIAVQGGAYSIDVACRVPLRGMCGGTISISAPRPVSAEDRELAQARSLLARAEESRREGNRNTWPEALREYNQVIRAVKLLHRPELLRAALTGKARLLLFDLNHYQGAAATAALAAEVSSATGDLAGQALAWKTLGSARYYLGDYPGSRDAGKRALALYRSTGDEYWQGIVLGNLAYQDKETGDTDEGLVEASSALKIAQAIGDGYGIDFDLETLATLHLERGEMESAFEFYQRALDALQKQPYPDEADAVWNGLGELYTQLHDAGRAREALQNALYFSAKAHDTAGELEIVSNLGDLSL